MFTLPVVEVEESVASVDMEAGDCHVDGCARVTRRRRTCRFMPPLDKMPRCGFLCEPSDAVDLTEKHALVMFQDAEASTMVKFIIACLVLFTWATAGVLCVLRRGCSQLYSQSHCGFSISAFSLGFCSVRLLFWCHSGNCWRIWSEFY